MLHPKTAGSTLATGSPLQLSATRNDYIIPNISSNHSLVTFISASITPARRNLIFIGVAAPGGCI